MVTPSQECRDQPHSSLVAEAMAQGGPEHLDMESGW